MFIKRPFLIGCKGRGTASECKKTQGQIKKIKLKATHKKMATRRVAIF